MFPCLRPKESFVAEAKMFLNLFRNILLPQQMFPRLCTEQCFLVCRRLRKGRGTRTPQNIWLFTPPHVRFGTFLCRPRLDNRDLQILGRERLRVPNFLVEKRARARKPASFWREKRVTVVILVRGFAKMSTCQNKSTTR